MIAAFETASTDLSVALAGPDGSPIAAAGWSADRRQGHETLPRLMELLAGRERGLGDLTGVAVGTGPGSFTGLRVGMSLAKGLALSLDLPIVGVPSLPAWLEQEPRARAALARAGARDGYLLMRDEAAPRIVDRDELPSGTTAAPLVAPYELAEAFGLRNATPPARAALAVAALAARRLAVDPHGDDLARLEPAYLRAPRGIGQVAQVETR